MLDENVVQPLLVTTSALNLATECVRMILKVHLTASQLCGLMWEGHVHMQNIWLSCRICKQPSAET